MDIRDFGDALLRTGDLDPVYIGIYKAKLPEPQVCRLLLAYWCFYHLGVSAWMSQHEGGEFWRWMTVAARNNPQALEPAPPTGKLWPRGTERRHFRGEKCVKAVGWFTNRWPEPEHPVRLLATMDTDKAIINKVVEWPMFGPWIGFKVADMMERVYGASVKFNSNIGLMYDSPRAALDVLVADDSLITTDRTPVGLYGNLLSYFAARKAPPGLDRYVNAQEVETILCKWGSMKGGHYHVGKDIHEIRQALNGWGDTAKQVLAGMPEEVVNE